MSVIFQVGEFVEVVEHHLDSNIVLKIGGIYQIIDSLAEGNTLNQRIAVKYQSERGVWRRWWVSEKCLAPLSLENE